MLAKLSLNVVGAIYATNHSMSFLRLSSSMHCTVLDWTGLDWTVLDWTVLDCYQPEVL